MEKMLPPQPSLLQEIGVAHQVRFTHQFVGHKKLELGEGESHVFLGVLPDGKKVNVKTAQFYGDEIKNTREFGELMEGEETVKVPKVMWGDYDETTGEIKSFATEHIHGWPYTCETFWVSRPMMSRAMQAFDTIDKKLNPEPLSEEQVEVGRRWMDGVLTDGWVKPILGDKTLAENNLITPEFVGTIQKYISKHAPELRENMRMVWRDPNGDNLIWPAYDTDAKWVGVVGIGLAPRPKDYMKMRFLAWSLVKIDDKTVDLETWVNKMRAEHHLGDEMSPTFVLSLTGILYDLTKQNNGERDNKNRRLIAIAVKNIITSIIKKDEAGKKTAK